MYTTSTEHQWFCWQPFNKAMTWTNRQNQPTSKNNNANNTNINQEVDGLHMVKLNTDKTEFINFSSKQQLKKLDKSPLDANGDLIHSRELVRYLTGHLDSSLTFETHVKTNGKLHQDWINPQLPIDRGLHHTCLNAVYNTHRLCKCHTIQIYSQGHQQVPITAKYVCKINIKKTKILKINGISLQITLAASTSKDRLQNLNSYSYVHPGTSTKIPTRPN